MHLAHILFAFALFVAIQAIRGGVQHADRNVEVR